MSLKNVQSEMIFPLLKPARRHCNNNVIIIQRVLEKKNPNEIYIFHWSNEIYSKFSYSNVIWNFLKIYKRRQTPSHRPLMTHWRPRIFLSCRYNNEIYYCIRKLIIFFFLLVAICFANRTICISGLFSDSIKRSAAIFQNWLFVRECIECLIQPDN